MATRPSSTPPFSRLATRILVALLLLAARAPAAGTPESPPALDGPLFEQLADLPRTHHFVESLQVEQRGATLWEYFARPALRDKPHELRSAAKSLLSAALGAVHEGRAGALIETPVWSAFGRLLPAPDDPRRARITFEDVITMRSGHACEPLGARHNPCDPRSMGRRSPWKAFLLAPMRDEPGTRFVYTDGAPHVIAALLVLLGGKPPGQLLKEALLEPLGMDPRAGMDRMSPADMRRFGTLMLQQGCWQGRQLIAREWVRRSTAAQVHFAAPNETAGYGYFWWTRRVARGESNVDLYYAAGNGGQLVMVVPPLDAVLVTTGNAWERLDRLEALVDELALRVVPALPGPAAGSDAHARCMAAR
jgi:CubicO group peptidase (beta-lactamase class C family)